LITGFIGFFVTRNNWLHFAFLYSTNTSVHTHVFTGRCLVVAFNYGRSPSSGFPNCPLQQLTVSHSNGSQRQSRSGSQIHQPTTRTFFTSLKGRRLSHTNLLLFSTEVKVKVKVTVRPTVSRPVCLGVRHPFGTGDNFFSFFLYLFLDSYGFVDVEAPSLTRGQVCNFQYNHIQLRVDQDP
jgi:hypothetical protein